MSLKQGMREFGRERMLTRGYHESISTASRFKLLDNARSVNSVKGGKNKCIIYCSYKKTEGWANQNKEVASMVHQRDNM